MRNNTFSFIFCEHFIEHLSVDDGPKFLKECYRILRVGGILRITTPDLNKLIRLYFDVNEFAKREEVMKVIYGKEANLPPCEMFNNYMRRWGHKFIYDTEFLTSILKKAGFTNFTFCENKKSNHEDLANIERHYEDYKWMNPAETITIEAEKPS